MFSARLTSVSRFVLGQVAGVAIVLLALVFVTSLISDVVDIAKWAFRRPDSRALLPAYTDHERARQILSDAAQARTKYFPYIIYRRRPLDTPTLHIDERGLRVHSAGRDDGPGATTVGFFGGSTIWGTGVADDDTIPALFDQRTRGFAVTNYGETGYTSRQSLALLINLLNQGEGPEVAVFYDGFNDVWQLCDLAVTENLNGQGEERKIRRRIRPPHRWGRLYHHLVEPLVEFIDGIHLRDLTGGKPAHRYVCAQDPERADRVAETLLRNWEIAHRLVTGAGGRFHAFLQPVAYLGAARVDHLDLSSDAEDQFQAVYGAVRRKLAERGWPWAEDLSDAFDGDTYLYIDYCHVVAEGNERIAERVAARLADGARGSDGTRHGIDRFRYADLPGAAPRTSRDAARRAFFQRLGGFFWKFSNSKTTLNSRR